MPARIHSPSSSPSSRTTHDAQGHPLTNVNTNDHITNTHHFTERTENKIDAVTERAGLLETKCINIQIRRRNSAIHSYEGLLSGSKVMVLPRKECVGDGVQLANALLPSDGICIPLTPLPFENIPKIGSAPNNGTIDVNIPLSHDTILHFIQFYNDHFGILPHEDLQTRQERFHKWLRTWQFH